MSEEIKNEDEATEKPEPVTVKLEKEETKPEPDFDNDNYLATEEEIIETEQEIEKIAKEKQVKHA